MTKNDRVRYQMFLEVKDFGAAHRELFPEAATGEEAFAELSGAIAQIDAHEQARPLAAIDGQKERATARQAVQEAMRDIARTAKGIKAGDAQPGTLLLPRGKSAVAWMQAAPAFIQQAETMQHQLQRLGLPATCIDDLRARVCTLERILKGRRSGRRGVAQASGATRAAFRRALAAIRTLDIAVGNAVKGNDGLTAEWQRCREVTGKSKRTAEAVDTGDAAAPAASEPIVTPSGAAGSDPLKVAS